MTIFFSPSVGGFLDGELCQIPADGRAIPPDRHRQLMEAQAKGARIQTDDTGFPVAVFPENRVDTLRDLRRSQLNEARTARERAGFPYRGKRIDADQDSVDRMTTAVLAAMAAQALGGAFAVNWTCADNTELPLDAAGVIGMPVAFATFGQALHDYCKARKAELQSLDLAALQAFDVTAGWPAG